MLVFAVFIKINSKYSTVVNVITPTIIEVSPTDKSTTEKICKENNIEKHIVIAQGKECEVFSDVVIDLIHKSKPQGLSSIPENYITSQELAKYLKVSLSTLSDLEFWCWDFKKYKKSFSGVVCYQFTEEVKDFYNRKLYKWRHPDRKHGTCWQR